MSSPVRTVTAFASDAMEPYAMVIMGERALRPPLERGRATVIGRGEDCDLRIDDASVSRRHARLQVDAEGATIEDLGSHNGTLLNGRQDGHRAPRLRRRRHRRTGGAGPVPASVVIGAGAAIALVATNDEFELVDGRKLRIKVYVNRCAAVTCEGTACRKPGSCDAATGACSLGLPFADGTSCADGDACNGMERCRAGECAAGTPVTCDDGDICTSDVCEPSTGACSARPIAGCCRSDADCNDLDACTIDICSAPGGDVQPHHGRRGALGLRPLGRGDLGTVSS